MLAAMQEALDLTPRTILSVVVYVYNPRALRNWSHDDLKFKVIFNYIANLRPA